MPLASISTTVSLIDGYPPEKNLGFHVKLITSHNVVLNRRFNCDWVVCAMCQKSLMSLAESRLSPGLFESVISDGTYTFKGGFLSPPCDFGTTPLRGNRSGSSVG